MKNDENLNICFVEINLQYNLGKLLGTHQISCLQKTGNQTFAIQIDIAHLPLK